MKASARSRMVTTISKKIEILIVIASNIDVLMMVVTKVRNELKRPNAI